MQVLLFFGQVGKIAKLIDIAGFSNNCQLSFFLCVRVSFDLLKLSSLF